MAVITVPCKVNENRTIGLDTLPDNMRVRLKGVFFEFNQKSSDYFLNFFPNVGSGFTFDLEREDGPIDWGEHGRPSWLTIAEFSSSLLQLRNDSRSEGSRTFTILNTNPDGLSIQISIQNAGGEDGNGGALGCALNENDSGLVDQLPAGVSLAGRDVAYGLEVPGTTESVEFAFEFTPTGSVVFNTPEELPGLAWGPPPDFISAVHATSDLIRFTATVPNGSVGKAAFTIHTNFGPVDPTIVGNPEMGGPWTTR